MPFIPLSIPAGVVKRESNLASTGRWVDADKMRFKDGKPEKIGGFSKLLDQEFDGYARGARAWASFNGSQNILFGTATSLMLIRNGSMVDITPYRTTATLTGPFTTLSGSTTVTVTDVAHGVTSVGTMVNFDNATAVGGITIDGDYLVASIPTADSYTIVAASAASSTATGGGTVDVIYFVNVGLVDPTYLTGWGITLWGKGGWGVAVSEALGILREPMIWSIDNYGEDAILCPLNGTLYYYDTSTGASRPTAISGAPAQSRAVFVTPERYIFALGCTNLSGVQDEMTVRWPDVEDFTDWTPSSIDTANTRKLQGGSRLIAGTGFTLGLSFVWSDSSLFAFQFTGSSTIYDSRKVADECGLIGPQAFCKSDAGVFWMSSHDFHFYNGSAATIPNSSDVADWVFGNLNERHAMKSLAYYNRQFNEAWFLFPTTGTEPGRYVAVNLTDYSWTVGTMARTAVAKFSTGELRPIFFGTDGFAWAHEDPDSKNDGASAMEAYIEMAPFELDGGNISADVFGYVPDMQRQSGIVELYIYGIDHPRDGVLMSETLSIGETDTIVDARVAGREIGLKLTSDVVDGDFRLGAHKVEISGAGKKRSQRATS